MTKKNTIMEKEMNFFDLCVACGHGISRGCKAFGRLLGRMIRLTYRYWWIVLTVLALSVAAGLFYTRYENSINKVYAVAMVNVGSIQQFEQAFAPLRTGKMIPEDKAILGFLADKKASHFETYRVIDCLGDGSADFIDYKRKTSLSDTINVVMQDRICMEFRVKNRDLGQLPEMEQAVLDFLNANEALQQSYLVYLDNLRDEAVFDHNQAVKLDSLTSHYYFRGHIGSDSFEHMQQGTVVMSDWGGDWKVKLFLDKIYEQRVHLQATDYRYHLATAPVVLENHFSVHGRPVNDRKLFIVLFLLLGWIVGCAIASMVDNRKAISTWLKQ